LSSTWKRIKLKNLQQKLGIQPKEKPLPKPFQPKCSCCKTGNLVTIAMFDLRTATMVFGDEPKSANA
jgi:hypothetical protein